MTQHATIVPLHAKPSVVEPATVVGLFKTPVLKSPPE